MKKLYISPFVAFENIDEELLVSVSKTQTDGTTTHVPTEGIEVETGEGSQTGEGMNGAKGATFVWDDDLF